MNTKEINSLLSRDNLSSTLFGGAMAADEFSRVFLFSTNSSFVVNSHVSSLPGEHWLAVYCCTPYYVEFFDSYGLPVEMYPLIHSTLDPLPITSNSTQLQCLSTDVCGNYCVALGLAVARGVDMRTFVSYWRNKRDRDFIIGSMIRSRLHPH